MNQQGEWEALLTAQRERELLAQKQAAQEKEELPQSSDFRQLIGEICGIKVCEEQKQNMEDTMLELLETPDLPTKEPEYSLSMWDKHLSTIPKTELDEVIKSSVKNLVPIPSESEVTSKNKSGCDLPVNVESSLISTTFSNPLFDCHDDFTSSDDESLSNEDEFSGELAHINPIPLGIEEADFDLEEEIRLVENLLYDNLSPRPPEEINAKIIDTIIESLSPSPILIEDIDSQMEEIDLFLDTDNLNKSSNFDHHDDPSFPRPPPKLPDVEVFFEPDSGVLTTKVVKGISEHYVLMPNILPTLPTFDPLYPVYDTLPPFSSKNEDKVFKPGILSYLLVSHRDKTTSDFSENPMMMYEGDIPLLDAPYLYFYLP
uniref:Reverse transcriptase domain-containing protein n=1 Tax=Tanacetum cinerariifolium TaxID=118510 RepID=A0A6L2MK23_TANCI|nr:hypothetical protein [Tanacetum cinerariifolium]